MIALFLRDLRLAFRSGGGFGLALAFFLIVVVLTPLSIGPNPQLLSEVSGGILWIGALLACLLSLDRIFGLDAEDGTLDALATSPLPLEGVYLGKTAAHWVTTGLPLTLIAPGLAVMLGLPNGAFGALTLSLLIGTPALSAIGAFSNALTVGIKRGGLLLSIIVLPLYVPTLIFGADITQRAGQGLDWSTGLLLLSAITLFCLALLPFAAAAALRINLR